MTTIMISRHNIIDFNLLKSSVHTNTPIHKHVYSVQFKQVIEKKGLTSNYKDTMIFLEKKKTK